MEDKPAVNNRDEVYRTLDMKLTVNDDGAAEITRHGIEPRSGVALSVPF